METTIKPIDSPIHRPVTPQPKLKAQQRSRSAGPITQWPMTLTIIGVRVSPTPRSTPVVTAWVPSNSWKAAAMAEQADADAGSPGRRW